MKRIAAMSTGYASADPAEQIRIQRSILRAQARGSSLDGFAPEAISAASGATVAGLSAQLQGLTSNKKKAAAELANLNKGFNILTPQMNDAHSAARGLASGFGLLWLTWGNIAPLLAGAAISNSFVQVVKVGSEVNHTLETMRVLTGQTAEETKKLTDQMYAMAQTGPAGPKELAEGMKVLALAGLDAVSVSSAIKDVFNLSVAGDTSMKTAADVLLSLIHI